MSIEDSEERRIRRIERVYQWVYAHLEPSELIKHDHSWPEQKGVLEKSPDTSDTIFLDYYSVEGVRLALESYGFLDVIRKKQLGEPKISIHRHEKGYDIVRVHTEKTEFPIVELVAQTGPLDTQSAKLIPDAGEHKFLHVRWLRMQNPLKKVKPDRPLLPGQDFVGLGLGREMMVLLQMVCNRLQLDGIIELPERLHNAALYFRHFRFFDPEMQGILTAILRDTRKHSLNELAWGMEIGALVHKETRKTYRWIAKEQVLPRAGPILLYLNSKEYRDQAKAVMEANHFSLQTGDLALDQIIAEGKQPASYGDLFPSKGK